MEVSLITGVAKRIGPSIVAAVVAGAGIGYAIHEHHNAQTLAAQNSQVSAQLNATKGQMDALTAKVSALDLSGETKAAAQTASAPASSQTTEPVAQPTAPITPTVPPSDPAAPSSGKQNPPAQQFATQAPPSLGQQKPLPQQLAADSPQAFEPAPLVIPAGTRVQVRLEQTIDTKRNRSGDRFRASLTSPIAMNGEFLVPAGTTFEGHVTLAKPSGRFKGRAQLGLELDSFRLDGVDYRVVTAPAMRVSGRHRKRNWILIGGGAGFGAAVGAVAGVPGALIGAGAGAGAGAVGAFFTGRKNVSLAVETPLTFRFQSGVELAGG